MVMDLDLKIQSMFLLNELSVLLNLEFKPSFEMYKFETNSRDSTLNSANTILSSLLSNTANQIAK